ncbi:hypothetical protein FQN60_012487 [Etheostoma spectabile]|uniref:Uncharacterized protein n=1 Tax=Etheostoma spectabile TaxID=54343 RepID=A0A5J5DQ07_9PERO|nr:hypothetical protein FQN60_012487 [Etheostoma spectabile]
MDVQGKGKVCDHTRPFLKNEVVLDYHGHVVTRA